MTVNLAGAPRSDNPFPGLRRFEAEETHLFFGRDGQSTAIIVELERTRFVAVVGTSGSGKSSLVRAGLLPQLEGGFMSRAGSCWRIALMTPGDAPIHNLALALASPSVLGEGAEDTSVRAAQLEAVLRRSSVGLIDAVRQARLDGGENLLIVVDQFEELFRMARLRQSRGQDEAAAFVALLIETSRQIDKAIYVVLTMRSDFLGDCAQFRDLPETLNRGQYLIPRMSRDERRAAIEGPVAVSGARIAPRLVQQVLNDVGDNPDHLPLMQHALMRTWEAWKVDGRLDAVIDLDHYRRIGALDKALWEHADQALAELTDPIDRAIAHCVFQRLCERTADYRETRRPTRLSELCEVAGTPEDRVVAVIDRFRTKGRTFLVPPLPAKLDASTVIDISHEALIRQWGTLRSWVKDEAESAAMYKRLAVDAARYADHEVSLWRDPQLRAALAWRDTARPTAAWADRYHPGFQAAMAFLDESGKAARTARRRSLIRVGVIVALALAIIVGTPWMIAGHQVDLKEKTIELQMKTKSRELAYSALLDAGQNPARGAHAAIAAMNLDPENIGAEYALRQAMAALEIAHVERIVPFGHPIADARLTRDKSRLVVASGNTVAILDAQTLERVSFAAPATVLQAWLIAGNALVLTQLVDGRAQIQALDGHIVSSMSCAGAENDARSLSVSPDERHVAVGCLDGEISIWDATSTSVKRNPPLAHGGKEKGAVTALSFSADSEYLGSGDSLGHVNIWKLGQSEPWIRAQGKGKHSSPIEHGAAVRDIGFHPTDSELVATASDDGTAKVWKLDYSPKRRGLALITKDAPKNIWKLEHDRPVLKARFAPRDGSDGLLMTVSDKRVYFWEDDKSKQVGRHDDWVEDASASDDGEYVVSASNDGTVRAWSTRSGVPIAVLHGHTNTVSRAFFGSGGRFFTTSLDGTLRAWALRPPKLLVSENRWMLSAAFDPSGKHVVLCGEGVAGQHCRVVELDAAAGPSVIRVKFEEIPEADSISNATWSRDGRYVAAIQGTHDIYADVKPILWDIATGKRLRPKWLNQWRTAAFGSVTTELVTVKADGEIAVWEISQLALADPTPKTRFAAKPNRWWAEISPDGRWVAAIEDNQIALLDRRAPDFAPRMLSHGSDIKTARFSRDGKRLVTASADRTARIWRVDTIPGESEVSVELAGGHSAALSSAVFSADARRVATSSADNTIAIWDAQTGDRLITLKWHSEGVNDVQFEPNGQRILSASDDGTVKLSECDACTLPPVALRERVGDLAVLTQDERESIRAKIPVVARASKLRSLAARSPNEIADRK